MRKAFFVSAVHGFLRGSPLSGLKRWCNGGPGPAGLKGRWWSSLTMMVSRSQKWPAP